MLVLCNNNLGFYRNAFSKVAANFINYNVVVGNLWSTRFPNLFNLKEDLKFLFITQTFLDTFYILWTLEALNKYKQTNKQTTDRLTKSTKQTPCRRAISCKIIQQFAVFCENQRFITVFTRGRHGLLSNPMEQSNSCGVNTSSDIQERFGILWNLEVY